MAAAMNMAPRSPGLLAGPHETRSAAAVFQGHQHRPQPYPSKPGLSTDNTLDWDNVGLHWMTLYYPILCYFMLNYVTLH